MHGEISVVCETGDRFEGYPWDIAYEVHKLGLTNLVKEKSGNVVDLLAFQDELDAWENIDRATCVNHIL